MRKRRKEEVEKDLNTAINKLKDVQERGDKAISEYDLKMGYDANFYLNVCPMLQSHVNYYTNELNQFDPDFFNKQFNFFPKKTNRQLTLF